jgi:hypothetical protein
MLFQAILAVVYYGVPLLLAQEVNRGEEKRGLMDIDVGERDNDSDMSPSKK